MEGYVPVLRHLRAVSRSVGDNGPVRSCQADCQVLELEPDCAEVAVPFFAQICFLCTEVTSGVFGVQ